MEKEIVEYKVIVSGGFVSGSVNVVITNELAHEYNTALSFETEVANAIAEGWQPFGGVSHTPGNITQNSGTLYMTAMLAQAMVKYKKQ